MLAVDQVVTLRFATPAGWTVRRTAVVQRVSHPLPMGAGPPREGPFTTFAITSPNGLCYTFPCLDSLLPEFVEGWAA